MGGGHIYRVGIGVARIYSSLVPRPSHIHRLQYVSQKPENEATYIEPAQSSRWVWGACSPRKILKFRPCESASEAVGDHYNICGKLSATHRIIFFRSPFPLELAFVFEALPQNCPFNLGDANLSALCMEDMKQ